MELHLTATVLVAAAGLLILLTHTTAALPRSVLWLGALCFGAGSGYALFLLGMKQASIMFADDKAMRALATLVITGVSTACVVLIGYYSYRLFSWARPPFRFRRKA